MKQLRYLLILILFACHPTSDNGEENVLARVYDDYLFESEIEGLVPAETSPRDSLILVKNYISNWIKNKILIDKAEENLTDEQQDFSKQLEEYRNSLLVFEYEKNILDKELDTNISNEEAFSYYSVIKSNFPLKEKLFQVRFININESYFNADIKNFFLDSSKLAHDTLYKLIAGLSENYDIESGRCFNIMELKKQFPLIRRHENDEFVTGSYYELNENSDLTMLNISAVYDIGEMAPYSYIKPQIREIILNKRKTVFLKQLKQEILDQAIGKNEVEIY